MVPAPSRGLSGDRRVLKTIDQRIRRKAERIVLAAARTPELAEVTEEEWEAAKREKRPPRGWTRTELKIAMDADKGGRDAPVYLSMMRSVLDSYKRAEAGRPTSPTLNVTTVVISDSQVAFPTLKVER